VKRVQITAVSAAGPEDNLLILAGKDELDLLKDWLSLNEYDFLRQAVSRGTGHFFFARGSSAVFVKILKQDKDEHAAREDARLAGSDMLKELRHYKIETVTIRNACSTDRSLYFAEGMALGSYQFLKHFSNPSKKEKPLREIVIECDGNGIEEMNAVLDAVFMTRDLVNEPWSHQNTLQFADAVGESTGRVVFGVVDF
jgi:leucyl aminopeptidase